MFPQIIAFFCTVVLLVLGCGGLWAAIDMASQDKKRASSVFFTTVIFFASAYGTSLLV